MEKFLPFVPTGSDARLAFLMHLQVVALGLSRHLEFYRRPFSYRDFCANRFVPLCGDALNHGIHGSSQLEVISLFEMAGVMC